MSSNDTHVKKKVIIVVGVAGGASCAARLRRLDEKVEILIKEMVMTMKRRGFKWSQFVFWFAAVIVMALPLSARAQSAPADGWEIRVMPYVYFLSIEAESTVSGDLRSFSGNVDLDFDDIVDYLDFGVMGRIEAWKGPWGVLFDGLFMNLGAGGSFQSRRELVEVNLDADVRLGTVDLGLAYRVVEKRFGDNNKQRFAAEPYGGLRYGYLRQEVDLDVDIAGVGLAGRTLGTSEDWVEPFFGGRVIWDLNDKWSFNLRGDVGGFGIGSASELTWQVAGGVDYRFSDAVILNAGYRYIDLDYSRGSGANEFGIDLQANGPVLGLTIVF